MPIYVYECQDCGEVFEVQQRIIEDALTDCRECEAGSVKRVIQPTAVVFKGSGFYINDTASAKPSTESKPKTESKPEPAKADSGSKAAD
jgi:putative FmdB family regulatory protein